MLFSFFFLYQVEDMLVLPKVICINFSGLGMHVAQLYYQDIWGNVSIWWFQMQGSSLCYSPKILILVATRFCNWSILPDAIICNLFEYINFSKNNPICQISDFKIPGVLTLISKCTNGPGPPLKAQNFLGRFRLAHIPFFFPFKWPNFFTVLNFSSNVKVDSSLSFFTSFFFPHIYKKNWQLGSNVYCPKLQFRFNFKVDQIGYSNLKLKPFQLIDSTHP